MSKRKEKLKSEILGARSMLKDIRIHQIKPLERELKANLKKLYPNCLEIEDWALNIIDDPKALERMDSVYGR